MLMNVMNFQEGSYHMQDFPDFIIFLDLHKVGPTVTLHKQTMLIFP